MNFKNKKGFSLLELLLVLCIVAAFVVAAFIIYPKVSDRIEAKSDSEAVNVILQGIREMYNNQKPSNNFSTATMINAKIIPESYVYGGGIVYLPGHHNLTIQPDSSSSEYSLIVGSDVMFNINSISSNVCPYLASNLMALNPSYMAINGNQIVSLRGVKSAIPDIVTACNTSDFLSINVSFSI